MSNSLKNMCILVIASSICTLTVLPACSESNSEDEPIDNQEISTPIRSIAAGDHPSHSDQDELTIAELERMCDDDSFVDYSDNMKNVYSIDKTCAFKGHFPTITATNAQEAFDVFWRLRKECEVPDDTDYVLLDDDCFPALHTQSADDKTYWFEQYYKGIPTGHTVEIAFAGDDNALIFLDSSYEPIEDSLDVNNYVDEATARKAIPDEYAQCDVISSRLAIAKDPRTPDHYLQWQFEIDHYQVGHVYVKAKTGEFDYYDVSWVN